VGPHDEGEEDAGADAEPGPGLHVVALEVLLETEDHEAGEHGEHGAPPEPPQGPPEQLAPQFDAGPGLELRQRRRLHEVEVVEQADPGDACEVVTPAGDDDAARPGEEFNGCQHGPSSSCAALGCCPTCAQPSAGRTKPGASPIPSLAMATFDDVLAAGYLDDLRKMSLDVVRTKRGECQTVEAALSMERRLVQGRLDIVGAELRRRAGDPSDQTALVDDLKNILAERVRSPGYGRLSQLMAPAGDDELVAEIEAAADASRFARLGDMDDAEVRTLADKLGRIEQELSERRRKVHERIDALQEEVVRRYKEGEATVEGLLSQ